MDRIITMVVTYLVFVAEVTMLSAQETDPKECCWPDEQFTIRRSDTVHITQTVENEIHQFTLLQEVEVAADFKNDRAASLILQDIGPGWQTQILHVIEDLKEDTIWVITDQDGDQRTQQMCNVGTSQDFNHRINKCPSDNYRYAGTTNTEGDTLDLWDVDITGATGNVTFGQDCIPISEYYDGPSTYFDVKQEIITDSVYSVYSKVSDPEKFFTVPDTCPNAPGPWSGGSRDVAFFVPLLAVSIAAVLCWM